MKVSQKKVQTSANTKKDFRLQRQRRFNMATVRHPPADQTARGLLSLGYDIIVLRRWTSAVPRRSLMRQRQRSLQAESLRFWIKLR